MPVNAAVLDPVLNDQRTSAKHKWRGKLFSNEGKGKKNSETPENLDDNVSDFLHPAGSKIGTKPSSDLPAPRIDISAARRWPSAAEVIQSTTINPTERPRKPPRREGLHVTFENAAPEVIGVGGDEAESPAIAVSRRPNPNSQHSLQPDVAATGSQPLQKDRRSSILNNPFVPDNHEKPRPSKLHRRPTGLDYQPNEDNASVNDQDYQPNGPRSFAPPRSPERISSQQTATDRNGSPSSKFDRRAEPGIVSNSDCQVEPGIASISITNSDRQVEPRTPTSSFFDVTASRPPSHSPRPQGTSKISDLAPSLKLPFFDQSFSFENSLTPLSTPTPEQPELSRSISSSKKPNKPSVSFENSLTPLATPTPEQPVLSRSISSTKKPTKPPPLPEYFEASQANALDEVPQERPGKEEPVSQPLPEIRTFSIRDIAKNLGDDALNDFASRVQRFNAIFQIGATVKSPVTDIPFVQWIRTSAYWFLKGRGELERAVRCEAREPQGSLIRNDSNISLGLRQAYLDLAKAWWILEEITPDHPELREFGPANLNSLKAIIGSFGEAKLVELIDVQIGITGNMRALTMSMKRNDRLPPLSFEIQGLETRIFIELPRFPPNVAVVLSERSQHFTTNDSPHMEVFPIPVGDTTRHFVYSSVIVDLMIVSQVDGCEDIRLPCVLSVLRERSDLDLKAVIASQDGKVKLLIQSDKQAGLAWDGVSWEIKTNSIRLKLSNGVDIRVQFWERDFKSLWGIHDYTRKVREGLRCAEGEQQVFQDELKNFQRTDQESTKTFPTEPIKGCSIRLFEKKRTFSNGSGKRRMYGGHRLMIVTPSSLKMLSSINLDLDKKHPILFNYFRDAETAPALLLKIAKPSLDSFMVMTFHKATNRGTFHSLIDGTSVAPMEICSESLPLDSFTISEMSVVGLPSFPGQNFVNALRWEKLRVINKASDGSPHINRTVLPGDLRIWMECETGSFVDRMNFGKISHSSFGLVLIATRPWRDADKPLCRSFPGNPTSTTPTSGCNLFICQKQNITRRCRGFDSQTSVFG